MRETALDRQSIRKRGWDYTGEGWYFLTINTHKGRALFGVVTQGHMILSEAGRAAEAAWFKSAKIRPGIELGEFIVMPTHVHGLVRLPEGDRRGDLQVARAAGHAVRRQDRWGRSLRGIRARRARPSMPREELRAHPCGTATTGM